MSNATLRTLPLPYRCAAELLLGQGERTLARLNGLFDHFEAAYGLRDADECERQRVDTIAVCERAMYGDKLA